LDTVDHVSAVMMDVLKARLGDRVDGYRFPPPVFTEMEGEFVALDLDAGVLTARFPVRERYLNPYGTLQGGIIAAAVDNTLGPLSLLVAPPNVTRRLEMKYSRAVTMDLGYILVNAELLERKDRWLSFEAEVCTAEGVRLARAHARHWILDGW